MFMFTSQDAGNQHTLGIITQDENMLDLNSKNGDIVDKAYCSGLNPRSRITPAATSRPTFGPVD